MDIVIWNLPNSIALNVLEILEELFSESLDLIQEF